MKVKGVKLDPKAREVIEVIASQGGESDTGKVKNATGIDSEEVVKYRFRKLAKAGLVETYQPKPDNGKPKPKQVELTEIGEEFVEKFDYEVEPDEDMSPSERIRRLESICERQWDEIQKLRE